MIPKQSLALAFLLLVVVSVSGQSDKSTLWNVPANEVVEKIHRGEPIEYDHIIINGDLNLSGIIVIANSSISITNSYINGRTLFNDITFRKPVNFKGSQFSNDAFFKRSTFNNNANFWGSKFIKIVTFEATHFVGIANFGDAQFNGLANFGNSRFMERANFVETYFNGESKFERSIFINNANFWGSKFVKIVDFSETKFTKYADFNISTFNGDASFRRCQFEEAVSFVGSQFSKNVNFEEAYFSGDCSFENSYFNKDISFKSAHFNNDVDFINSQFLGNAYFLQSWFDESAQFEQAQFSGSAFFIGAIFHELKDDITAKLPQFNVDWDILKGRVFCDEKIYLALIKNFNELRQFEKEDACYIQYRLYKFDKIVDKKDKIFDYLAWISCGYGVRPFYPIYWSVFLVFIFGLLLYIGDAIQEGKDYYKITKGAGYKNPMWSLSRIARSLSKKNRKSSLTDSLYFSAMIFFVSHPPTDWRPLDGWKFLVMIEDIIGWILMTLFVVTLGHVMIR